MWGWWRVDGSTPSCGPPAPRMRQRPDEQMGLHAPPPRGRRVRQLHPVPLGLLPRRVLDHRDRPAHGRAAGLARRAQPQRPHRPGHRQVRAGEPHVGQLVEQGAGPQVRIVGEALRGVPSERIKHVAGPGRPYPRLPFPVEVGGSSCGPDPDAGRSPRSSTPAETVRARRCRPPV